MIFRSLVAQWIASIYVGGISFILSLVIARYLGPEFFGSYAVALAVGSVLAIFIDGGMRNLLLRDRTSQSLKPAHLPRRLLELALGHALSVTILISILVIALL